MPQEWTTEVQKKFLQEELKTFKAIGGKNYMQHWPALYQRWFENWPEPFANGMTTSSILTSEQQAARATAIERRQVQVRHWMFWHAGAGESHSANAKTTRIMNDLLKPKKRSKQPCEVYSNLYYESRIRPNIKKGMSITELKKTIRETFNSETPEIKEEIHSKVKEMNRGSQKKSGDGEKSDPEGETEENGVDLDTITLCK